MTNALPNIAANLYKELENSLSFYFIRLSLDGHCRYVNKAFQEKFTFLGPQLAGVAYHTFLHPADINKCEQAIAASLKQPGIPQPVHLRKASAAGGYYLTYFEFTALQNQKKSSSEIICIGYDITETEEAIKEVKRNSDKLDVIIDNITDAFYILDKEWRFIKVNPAFEKLRNLKNSELIGKVIWETYPDASVEKLKHLYKEALETNSSIRFEEYLPSLGKWLERSVYPSQEGLTVLIKDITEHKQQEEKILDANNKLKASLNSTSDLNILISPSFQILTYNRVAAEFTRTFFDKNIAEGDDFWQYAPPGTKEVLQECIQQALDGQPVERKQVLSFAPGVELWYKLRFYPVTDTGGNMIGVSFNATNIDKAQRQLESLEEIASLYSQEVRRPVATIMGITRLINEDDLTPQNKEWFGYLITTTQELDRVINRIIKKSTLLD